MHISMCPKTESKNISLPTVFEITNPDIAKIGDFNTVRRPIYLLDKDVQLPSHMF